MKDKVLEGYVKSFSEDFDIEGNDEGKIFEWFINYNIISREYPKDFEFESVCPGGGDDIGIDGLVILVNESIVSTTQEIDSILKRFGYLDVKFVFIQSKCSDKFKGDQVGTFLFGVKTFFDDESAIPENSDIQSLREVKDYIYDKSINFDSKPRLEMYFVTTGEWKEPEQIRGRADRELKEIEAKTLFSNINFSFYDAEKIKEIYRELKRKVVKEIYFPNSTTFPEIPGIRQAFIGTISCSDYVELISNADKKLQKNLFYENVRDFQGHNPVNQEILETLSHSESQNQLAILNNGITIVAKHIEPIGKKLKLTDFQIVNGCQTSHMIFEKKDSLNPSAHLPVKVIETANADLTAKIIKATNRQTEVKVEAFESLTNYHKELEEFYNSMNKEIKYPIYYERRSKQYQDLQNIRPHQIISLPVQICTFLSMFDEQPHSMHRYYGELLHSNRSKLFRDGQSYYKYFASALCLNRLEHTVNKNMINKFYRNFKYHIIMLYRVNFIKSVESKRKNLESGSIDIIESLENISKSLPLFKEAAKTIEKKLKESSLKASVAVRTRDFTISLLK